MNEYIKVMTQHYADFDGRARRREFWMFHLIHMIILTIPMILGFFVMYATENILYSLAIMSLTVIFSFVHFIPSLAISVRRLHDTGKSGWWLLLGFTFIGAIVILVFYYLAGTNGPNQYGPDPKSPSRRGFGNLIDSDLV